MLHEIDHIAIVVQDIEQALRVYQDALGLTLDRLEEVPAEAVKVAFLPLGAGREKIELIQPTTTDSGVARYLNKRGEGIHHVCFVVEDIEAAVKQLTEQGLDILEAEPRTGPTGQKYVFVHPKSAHGVLIELYEKSNR